MLDLLELNQIMLFFRLYANRFPVVGLPVNMVQPGYCDTFLFGGMQKFIFFQIDSNMI